MGPRPRPPAHTRLRAAVLLWRVGRAVANAAHPRQVLLRQTSILLLWPPDRSAAAGVRPADGTTVHVRDRIDARVLRCAMPQSVAPRET